MKKKINFKKFLFGIRKQTFLSVTLICGTIYIFTYLAVEQVITNKISGLLAEQYTNVNDKLAGEFENLYEELNQLTGDFVINEYVQKTLRNTSVNTAEKEMLKRSVSCYNRSFLDAYLIVDNKENFYSLRDVSISYAELKKTEIYQGFGEEYSKTKLLWAEDTIFGTGEKSLFALRRIHEMNSLHEPGFLILKLNKHIWSPLREQIDNPELVYFIQDAKGNRCFEQFPDEDRKKWRKEFQQTRQKASRNSLKHGIVIEKTDADTDFTIVTFAPKHIANQIVEEVQQIMIILFLAGYILLMVCMSFWSERLARPIKKIRKVMGEFGDKKLDDQLVLDTNTELDYIGQAYNGMLGEVKHLMENVQHKERELKESELQVMLYQIRPHFLYNTLDTIYMLARIQKEETIMKMIQALSKFLRINLSNGNSYIQVDKEIEHVKAYMDIQKIRNTDLFDYQIEIQDSIREVEILKMTLQPVMENCIKYGFRDIYSDGMIWIRVYQENKCLCFSVENNGTPIEEEALKHLNNMGKMPLEEITAFVKKKEGGFGISNVVKRLRTYYGEQVSICYIRKEEGTECVIKIEEDGLSHCCS